MEDFQIGDRVQVLGKKAKGKLAFVGSTHFSEGVWYGVELDEPKGRNNGRVDGMQYFKCKRDHGVFVRRVQLGQENTGNEVTNNPSSTSKSGENCRVVYPNYLKTSSQLVLKRRQKSKSPSGSNSRIVEKEQHKVILPLYHLEKDVLHLKECLRSKSDELNRLKAEKESSDIRLKLMQEKLNEKSNQLDSTEELMKILAKDLSSRKQQMSTLKKEVKRLRLSLAELQMTRDTRDEECKQLMELAEYTTIEKEMAEVKFEELEMDFKEAKEKCDQLEVELEICKEEMELDSINGVPNMKYVKDLEEQNRVMRDGLMCLKQYYSETKQENMMREKTIKENLEEIRSLNETKNKLNELVEVYKYEIGDLQETVDSAAAAEEIICNLSEKNFLLEQKIMALEEVLKNANDLLEVNNELEEVLQEMERDYKEELESYRLKILNVQKVLACALHVVTEHNVTITKYREMTSRLKATNAELSERLGQIDEERKVAVIASETLKLRVRAKQDEDSRKIMQVENLQIDIDVAKEKMSYWSAYLPDAFLSQSPEHKAIEVMLTLSKMKMKVSSLSTKIEGKFAHISEDEMADMTETKVDELTFSAEFMSKLCYLENALRKCETSLQHCNVDRFLDIGKHQENVLRLSLKIDLDMELFTKDSLNCKQGLSSLEEAIEMLNNLFSNHINTPNQPDGTPWAESYMKLISVFSDCFQANVSRIQILTRDVPELVFESLLIDALKAAKATRKHAKSALTNLKDLEENIQFRIDSGIRDNLREVGGSIMEAMKLIVLTRQQVSQTDCELNLVQPCEWIKEVNDKIASASVQLENFLHLLQTGQCLTDQPAEAPYYPAVYQRALQKKHEGIELMKNLRRQLECSGQDLIRLMKDFQSQSKELDSVKKSTAMASNLEKPANEIVEVFSASEASMLNIQLQDFKHTVRFLKEENFRLQCRNVRNQLSDLKSLILTPAPPRFHQDDKEIRLLESKANKLAKEVHEIIMPTVVDISHPGSNSKMALVKRRLLVQQVEDKLEKLKADIADYKTSCRLHGAAPRSSVSQCEMEPVVKEHREVDERLRFYTRVDEEKLQKLRTLIARKKRRNGSSVTLC